MATDEVELRNYLRLRGDAAFAALIELRAYYAKQLGILDTVIAQIESIDKHINIKNDPKSSLASLMREQFPDKTEGLSDEQVLSMVGSGGTK